jgi:hypothetical protein
VRAAYTGHEALTFSQYMDGGTGRTLHAEPGGVYEVTPASGHVVPEIPAAWFVPVDENDQPAPDLWPVTPEGEPEPGSEQDNPEG